MPNQKTSKSFKYVDLFAGIGGFAAALEALGGEGVYSVDIDKNASEVYAKNWGHSPLGDITRDANDTVMNVPKHDILVAGFPCQPFSKSGAQKGMDETRGTLFWNILKIVQAHHPKIVLLENVRNLTGPRHTHEWEVIVTMLRKEGYTVSYEPTILSPHQIPKSKGGRPQVRERVFIAGVHTGSPISTEEKIAALATKQQIETLSKGVDWDLIVDLPLDSKSESANALKSDEIDWIEAWDIWVKTYLEKTGTKPPGFPIWVDAWIDIKDLRIQPGTPKWKADFLRKNSELYTENKTWLDKWAKNHSVNEFPPSRRKLEWQAQDTRALWDCLIQLRPSGIRAKKMTYVPALVAINQTSIIGPLRRKLSVREAARLQGFPEWFDLGGQAEGAAYKQLGNAVNVGAVWRAFKFLVERDNDVLQKSAKGRALSELISKAPENPDSLLKSISKRG
jgi:DNA (cytosine-5)-methyltransferase 1